MALTTQEATGNAAALRQRGHSLDGKDSAHDREERRKCFAEAHRLETMAAAGQFEPVKFSLARVRLDRGGYDRGKYYRVGTPLYRAVPDTAAHDTLEFRAADRAAARARVLKDYPNARFYR